MAAETLSLLFHSPPPLQLASYSNATTGLEKGEVDWKASHLPCFSRLTCLLEQFNWHFIPVLCSISCTARKRTSFFVKSHFYILWRCMNLRCCRFLFILTQLKRFRDAIGQVTPSTHSLLSLKILDPPN